MQLGNIWGFLLGGTMSGGAFLAHNLLSDTTTETPVEQLKFEDKLNEEQIELQQYLWNKNTGKHLLDYYDYSGWIKKAQEFSVKKDQWPSDIIFIADKSDKSLGEKLRDKCYFVPKWFPQKKADSTNKDVKEMFESVEKNFNFEFAKSLCSVSDDTSRNSKISGVTQKTLLNLTSSYECNLSKQNDASEDMKKYHELKKSEYENQDFCQIIKGMIISEISYSNGVNKYEVWRSRKVGSDYEIIPGSGAIYSKLEEIPGFSALFFKK